MAMVPVVVILLFSPFFRKSPSTLILAGVAVSYMFNALTSILLVSTELSEIFGLCDRIAVMYKGRFMGIYNNGDLTTARIGLLMAGIDEGEAK